MKATCQPVVLSVVAIFALLGGVGCGNPNSVKAGGPTIADTAGVFALTGAPTSGPTAINTFIPKAVRATAVERFDVVFDIRNGVGYAEPPHYVSASGIAGLLPTNTPYDAITEAPTSGYNDTLPVMVTAGTAFLIQSFSYGCTAQTLQNRRYIYSKVIIDSIHYYPFDPDTAPAGRTLYYRMVVDPNCGFTSLAPGIPSN